MMEWMKETLIGFALLAGIFLLLGAYILFNQIREEDSKRGKTARIIGKVGSGILWIYIAICSFCGIIAGIILLFT